MVTENNGSSVLATYWGVDYGNTSKAVPGLLDRKSHSEIHVVLGEAGSSKYKHQRRSRRYKHKIPPVTQYSNPCKMICRRINKADRLQGTKKAALRQVRTHNESKARAAAKSFPAKQICDARQRRATDRAQVKFRRFLQSSQTTPEVKLKSGSDRVDGGATSNFASVQEVLATEDQAPRSFERLVREE